MSDDHLEDLAQELSPERPGRRKRVIQTVIALVVVVAIFAGLIPQLVDYGDVWDAVRGMSAGQVGLLAVITAVYFGGIWALYMAGFPSMRLGEAAVQQQASTAVAYTVPAGGALALGVQIGMITSWGFTGAALSRGVVVVGIWDQFSRIAIPVLGAVLVVFVSDIAATAAISIAAAALIFAGAIVMLILVLRSDAAARWLGRLASRVGSAVMGWFHRGPYDWTLLFVDLRHRTVDLIRLRWVWLSAAALTNQLALLFLLVASLRAVGVTQEMVTLAHAVAAYSVGRVLTLVPVTPGGVGLVEFVFIALLTQGSGAPDEALIAAGVFTWRALTYLVPIIGGLIAAVVWRTRRKWHQDRNVVRRGEL